jgi:hypothetical protein
MSAGEPFDTHPALVNRYSIWGPLLRKSYLLDPVMKKAMDQTPPNGYTVSGGIMYHTLDNQVRLCVPNTPECNTEIKNVLLDRVHSALGHAGYFKTYQAISANFYWPNLAKDTAEYCKTCAVCQATKTSTQKPAGLLKPLPIPTKPFSHLSMDFLFLPAVKDSRAGAVYSHLWVIVDRFSKYTILIPLKDGYNALTLVELFMKVVYPVFGLPVDIVSDQDALFRSYIWVEFCVKNDISQSMSTAYHPETDGQSEVANKFVLAILRGKLMEGNGSWLTNVPLVAQAINSSIDAARGCTPNTLVF